MGVDANIFHAGTKSRSTFLNFGEFRCLRGLQRPTT